MRNNTWNDISQEQLIECLKGIATDDAEKDEFHREEHTCWMAAERIEDLQAMVDGKADDDLLIQIANRLRSKKYNGKRERNERT